MSLGPNPTSLLFEGSDLKIQYFGNNVGDWMSIASRSVVAMRNIYKPCKHNHRRSLKKQYEAAFAIRQCKDAKAHADS